MVLRQLIILATLAAFVPSTVPFITMDKAEAAQTVKKKKKKVIKRTEQPPVKKNFRGPRPGEPHAGWTDDCLFYYDVYGRLPGYCQPYGRGFRLWDR
jgi:hypothetical protein